jgi:hypothetical protein
VPLSGPFPPSVLLCMIVLKCLMKPVPKCPSADPALRQYVGLFPLILSPSVALATETYYQRAP